MQSTSFPSSSSPSPSSDFSQRVPASASRSSTSKTSSKDDLKLKYLQIPKNPTLSLKLLAYSTGATLPSTIKKVTRKVPKDHHSVFDWVFSGRQAQFSWVLQPKRHQKRGRSKNPLETDANETDTYEEDHYERDTNEGGTQQPMFDFSSKPPREPKLKGRSKGVAPLPPSSGHAGGSMAIPRHGHSKPSGFSHNIRSMVRSSRGISTSSPSRK